MVQKDVQSEVNDVVGKEGKNGENKVPEVIEDCRALQSSERG